MDIVNFPNGFRPTGVDFLKREQNKIAEFVRLREQHSDAPHGEIQVGCRTLKI